MIYSSYFLYNNFPSVDGENSSRSIQLIFSASRVPLLKFYKINANGSKWQIKRRVTLE